MSAGGGSKLANKDLPMHVLQLIIGLGIVAADPLELIEGAPGLFLAEDTGKVAWLVPLAVLRGHPLNLSVHVALQAGLVAVIVRELSRRLVLGGEVLALLADRGAQLGG